jgi:hypothetical protein
MRDLAWVIWWGFAIVSFGVLETYAFKYPQRSDTLSRFMWKIGQSWPLSIALLGALFGGLLVHFYWNWCPALMPPGVGG